MAKKATQTEPKTKRTTKGKEKVIKDTTEAKETKEIEEKKAEKTETAKEIKILEKTETDSEMDGEKETKKGPIKYYEAVGRRKTAIARVRLFTRGDKTFLINGKPLEKYFPNPHFKTIIEAPLIKMNCADRFKISVLVRGGGSNAQAEAIRHGITRALVMFNLDFKKRLKKSGYLTRDSRMKERKKPGLKRARRAPQWAKR